MRHSTRWQAEDGESGDNQKEEVDMQQYLRKDEFEQQWRERRAALLDNVTKTLEEVRVTVAKAATACVQAQNALSEAIYCL
jgi:hypothetical protein